MNRPDLRPLVLLGSMLLLAAAAALTSGPARSQAVDPGNLDDLVAPIALYPDDLLGIILPASTFPLDIVRAARFLDDLEQDPSLQPDASWDESVIALLNYPEVLRMMNEDLDWTWALGEAVLNDEEAVLAAAQDFRRRAMLAGNLNSDDKQIVSEDEGAIEIKPVDPEVVYVPVYEPQEVVVYQPVPVYHYYPYAYPLYYYPYPSSYFWPSDFFWGVTSYFSIGWHTHHLHLYHQSNRLHPYYLNSYYLNAPYYYRRNVVVTVAIGNDSNVWTPRPRRGGDRPRTVSYEGRTSAARTGRTVTTETQPGRTSTGIPAVDARRSRFSSGSGTPATGSVSTGTASTRTATGAGATTRRGTTRRGTTATTARGTTTREPAINGRVERSNATGSGAGSTGNGAALTRTRPVPSTTTTPSQSRSNFRSVAPAPSTTTAPARTRAPTPTPAPTPAPSAAPRRSSGVGTGFRSAPRPTPAPSSTPAPTRSSGSGAGFRSQAAPRSAPAPSSRASSSSSGRQSTRRPR